MISTDDSDLLGTNRGNDLLVAVLKARFPLLWRGEEEEEGGDLESALRAYLSGDKATQGGSSDGVIN